MNFNKITGDIAMVENEGGTPVIYDVQSALDLIASASYLAACNRLLIAKEDISEAFFDLSTGIAGSVLQKFVNYGFRIAIVGSFTDYGSKNLQDFIYECNKGNSICFAATKEDAIAALSR